MLLVEPAAWFCGGAALDAAGACMAEPGIIAAPEAAAEPVLVLLVPCIIASALKAACVLLPIPGMFGLILKVMPFPSPQCGVGFFWRQ